MRLLIALTVLVLSLLPQAAGAQSQRPGGSSREEATLRGLAPLECLVGEWEGTGWMDRGPAGRSEFAIHESARWVAGGTVLVLEGLGTRRLDDGSERTVHEAFAVLTRSADGAGLRIRAFRAGGGEVDAQPALHQDGLSWGFDDPRAGRIRFTVRCSESTWQEVGEVSRDGTSWTRFLEMELTRR